MAEQNKRNVSDSEFKAMFDYYNTINATAFVSEYTLSQIGAYPNWDLTLKKKIQQIKSFVKLIETKLNLKYSKQLGQRISLTNQLNFFADPRMPNILTKVFMMKTGNSNTTQISLNMPLDKLVAMPSLELYSLLSAMTEINLKTMETDSLNKLAHVNLEKLTSTSKTGDLAESLNKVNDHVENVKVAHKILTKYLEGFFKTTGLVKYYKEFDDIAALVAGDIISELTPESVEKMLGIFFDFTSLNEESIIKAGEFADLTPEQINELRIGKVYSQAMSLWKDPDHEPQALNVTQQYQALMSDRLREQFGDVVAKQSQGITSSVDVQKFCKNFADTYMESNGLNPIDITFDSNGELGAFIDAGKTQRINVNLSKIKSVSELVSTLSHELTHAKEAAINKGTGKQTKEGYGLADNIPLDISNSSLPKNSPEYALLREINKYCYRINPNERSARYGELSGLKFMHAIADSDKAREQLHTTINAFSAYQEKTLAVLKDLSNPTFVADLEKRVDEALKSNIPESDKQLIRERVAYIKKIMAKQNGLDKSPEAMSLKEIDKFAGKEMELAELAAGPMM